MVLILAGWLVDIEDVKGYTTNVLKVQHGRAQITAVRLFNVHLAALHPHYKRYCIKPIAVPVPGQHSEPPTQYIIPTGWKDATLQELQSGLKYSPEDETAVYVKEEGLKLGYPAAFFENFTTVLNPIVY